MCSIFLPRSSSRTLSPFSVSSLAAHPPEIPDPTTIASYVVLCTRFLLIRDCADSASTTSTNYEAERATSRILGALYGDDRPWRALLARVVLPAVRSPHDAERVRSLRKSARARAGRGQSSSFTMARKAA